MVDYFASKGAEFDRVTVNGKPATASALQELGHPVFRLDLEIPQGTTQEVTFHVLEPVGHGSPVTWKQPGVTPIVVEAFQQSC